MPANSQTDEYIYEEIVEGPDRVTGWMKWGIIACVVLILTVVVYGLLAGVLMPPAPRTATEFALKRAEASVREYPESGRAWGDYIVLLSDAGMRGQAWDALSRARAAVKDNTLVYINNAELALLMQDGEFKKAFDRSFEFMKFDDAARKRIAVANAKRGIKVPPQAQTELNRTTTEMLTYRAQAAIELKQYGEAIKALNIALLAEDHASDVLTLRGYAYLKSGDKRRAEADFRQALTYLPDYAPAIQGLKEAGAK